MTCPRCSARLRTRKIASVPYHRCPDCRGAWYDAGKFRLLKRRASHGDYRWVHIDLWKDEDKFRAGKQERLTCPGDKQTLVTVRYGDSKVRVDICEHCRGIWLDGSEYGKILRYLDKTVDAETAGDFVTDIRRELADAVKHPTRAADDIGDIAKVLHLLELRFSVQHKNIAELVSSAGRGIPGV